MGGSQSKNVGLVQNVSVEHKRKVEPLLRANHKHGIILDKKPREVSLISQSLAAACLLEVQPTSALFDLWDKLAINTVDITDSEEEIVETDYLSPDCLGHEDQYTRLLYSHTSCTKQYLQVEQVIDGLLARQGWGLRNLAYATEMGSKDMCTEALGGALSFYEPLQPNAAATRPVPQSDAALLHARDEIVDAALSQEDVKLSTVSDLVVLNSLCVLWQYLSQPHFAKLWNHVTGGLRGSEAPITTTTTTGQQEQSSIDQDHAWSAIIRGVCEAQPKYLPELRLLRDHPRFGLQVARNLFNSN
ncbi:protein of unknown function [Taphrina deformans PYCC 5710]|uniref:Uncharacterized protein n=1 Tax=Taphrina deformans (strain PYCC 5710 / ATCC 11124 / CBS 356.35 / IMI 108563 / JCM 9778 / NBRC 8474) TaxID=1097556 RepID=R4XDX3_TAPDE|nr:protein of unknown function [Taphrina deformans PYCC 5710]|eukprot:CCG84071.1 protein of unknown function [Taphrina deformans PYCC 5710]